MDKPTAINNLRVMIRGGGEMASGVAHRLFRSHLKMVMTEISQPLSVRREVSFCEAIFLGEKIVEAEKTTVKLVRNVMVWMVPVLVMTLLVTVPLIAKPTEAG